MQVGEQKLILSIYFLLLKILKRFLNAIDIFAKDSGTLIHSPVFYILIGKAKILFKFGPLKIIYIIISCSLPYIFYLVLKKDINIILIFAFIFH